MKLTFTKSKFDVPEGQYTAKFIGLEMLEPKPGEAPRVGRDGKPMAPGMAWRFEIVEGPETGKQTDRVTGRLPGPKNVCGRFLAAVTGQILKDGMEVDLDQYVGHFYRINVVAKEQSEGTCVSDQGIIPIAAPTPAANGHAAPPANGAAPPPRRNGTAVPAAVKYWVDYEGLQGDPPTMTEAEFRAWYQESKKPAAQVNLCPVGGNEWKACNQVFGDIVPW